MQDDKKLIEFIDIIPEIGQRSSDLITTEIEIDMSRFPTENHLASWSSS